MRKRSGSIAVLIMAALAGCLEPYKGETGAGLPEAGAPVEAVSELFTEGVNGGVKRTRFYTNDGKYRGPSGWTLWTAGGGEEAALAERAVRMQKASGSAAAGYGLVVCEAERGGERVFLTVMINNMGQYAVGKVRGGAYESVRWWTDTAKLNKGSLANEVTVRYAGGGEYELELNGALEERFRDALPPACGGAGRQGYVAVLGPGEPAGAGVEIWFEEAE